MVSGEPRHPVRHSRRQERGAALSVDKQRNGYQLTKADQVTIVAVAIAILVLTGLLVGLLF